MATSFVRALLLSLHLMVLTSSYAQHCSLLHIPPADVEYALLHINSFSPVEDMGNSACESFGVPKYKCGNVKKEILETIQEMARLAIREAVVNVSLDHSLAYDIWMLDEATQEQVKAPEPLVVYPEQPLADTISDYCTRYKLDNQSCENTAVGVSDLLARDWGCDDPITDEVTEFVEIPVLLDQQEHQVKVHVSSNGTVEAARLCLERKLHIAECAALIRIVREDLKVKLAGESGGAKEVDWRKSTDVRRRLRVNSPIDTRLYPHSERIYVKVDWERNNQDSDEEVAPEEVCVNSDYFTTPIACFTVPQTDPMFITGEGYHIFYFTDKSGKEILAATTFQIVVPTVDLVEIFTGASSTNSEYLVAKIRTTFFDPFDPAFRVCVLLDDSFDCLDPEWMAVDERELRHGTHKEPMHQSVTFRSPVDHVPFSGASGHEMSVLLLTDNNKAVHISNTLAFSAEPTVNSPEITSRLHILDPRVHTPQRPKSCPELLSTSSLRWICDLWRHEWGIYSQNGEDGIIRKIFRHIGTKDKSYVEFGTENGQECNTRLLRQTHGWKGLLMDSRHEDESIELHREFITRENFMPLLTEKYRRLVPRDLDLLSIDVDFNDFWLLNAVDLTRVSPRVIIVEVNSHIPPNEARTVQYDDSEDGSGSWDGFSSYFGGSVAAFYRWGTLNGYSLVYCESHGVNCFFVRNDVLGGVNVSAVLGPEQLQAPPNFFGQGWSYPDTWQPHHKWVWV
ncbi:hypothetical protein JG687_00011803 [Phytophthora cactorum]|uniref:Uncharacterized protein n=1 Tax=Phytophthora cactorum TaxID=29920 RepID=A0A8T1U8R7_9STRA|nr:hypothetical protein PC120_g18725 [Phytophthora cactorum]KAG3050697.1 hypothetical protein PC121_g18246 [Phytophthora cactorum]KAG3183628.1 hypothetical protein PC128_g14088 [Phytophthora cactorum]KAG4046294.1 hypothetical protein PC123_g18327 [Phytophthora cactorum]KAG6954463.1 hypothetical protein JG687_00011803 [Phytophthora cactorum]